MAAITYPTTIEGLIKSPWYSKLRTLVSRYRLNEPVEDTLSDIMCEMLSKKYLERWNPNTGSYSNWIYTFAANVCRKKYNRSNTRGGKALENASSIQVSSPDSDDFTPGVFFEDTLNVDVEDTISMDYNLLCQEISSILEKYPAHSSFVYKGVKYDRDMRTVFTMLRHDVQPKEIAVCLNTSVEFVYTLIRRMRPIILQVL